MTDLERMFIQHECMQLIIAFHRYADDWNHEGMLNLFAEDATFHHYRMGDLVGHKAIKAYLDSKETSSATTKHVTTNMMVQVHDADTASGSCYWTFYVSPPGSKELPHLLKGPASLGIYEDRYVKTPKGWRFSYRRNQPIFSAPHRADYQHLKADAPKT